MKLFLPALLFISLSSFSQNADFILVKKKSHTIQTIFAGRNFEFVTTSGTYINATINGIKNDTLYLQEFLVQRLPTTFGTYILDTMGSYHYKFHYNQVASLGPKPKKGFNMSGSGASLFSGGVILTLASGVIYLVDKKKFSAPLLLAAAGLGTAGYFLMRSGAKPMTIGKKYKLQYMRMDNASSN